jgi:C-terminal peptidase prc
MTTLLKRTGMLLSVLLALAAALPVVAAEEKSDSYVVLVGISQYTDQQIKPRPHAEDDAKALYDLFSNKDYLGVAPDHIRLLLGTADAGRKSEPATRENIMKAVHWIAATAKQDDLVVFAFIGQGAPLGQSGSRLGYLATDSTLKDRAKNAVSQLEIGKELDTLKSQRFCAFIDVDFHGYKDGPEKIPEPTLGESPYKEFRGSDGKEEHAPAIGRVVFLATNGLTSSIDLEKHGLFTQVLLDGLRGKADKDGYEPDGLVTVDELWTYVDKEVTDRAEAAGKTAEQKRQAAHLLESRSSHFVLSHNPAVTPQVAKRVAALKQLAKEQKITLDVAAEGEKLLTRMPKLKAMQDLRRRYQELVDGKLAVAEFDKQRAELLDAGKLKESAAYAYASKVIQATNVVEKGYVKKINQGDLVAWAIRGLYRQIDEKIPDELSAKLDKARDLDEQKLTTLLKEARERLGKREDLENHKDLDYSLQRMMAHLDPYTTYIDPDMVQRLGQEITGEFKGIGVSIKENRARGALQVISPLSGSPAYQAGIKAGDLILKITKLVDENGKKLVQPEEVSTKGMTTDQAVKVITGKPKTKVRLTIERKGVDKPLEVDVNRDTIELESVMGFKRKDNDQWDFYVDPSSKIAYVRLTTFARKTEFDLKKVLDRLERQGISGLVLDLRYNPGGLLTSAVEISDFFIDDGLIVKIKPRTGRENVFGGRHDGSFLNFPMVCLVNGMSASGSEIVAACLQDHERAVIMGERSYGKGSVQNILPFEGGELKMTTASFWRPNGKNLNKSSTKGREDEDWGVQPNKGFVVKMSEKEREQLYDHFKDSEIIQRHDSFEEKKPEFKDRQLDKALDYLRSQIKTASRGTAKKAG